jgi:hypothetical protein
MRLNDKLFRSWYYMRLGWQVYLALIFSIVNFIVVSHYFIITNNSFLMNIFPNLISFGILISVITFPSAILAGYFHMRYGAKKAENYIGYQVNPYFARRLVNTELVLRTYLIISKISMIANKKEKLTEEENELFMNEIGVMKNFLQSRTMSNKLDLAYIKTGP